MGRYAEAPLSNFPDDYCRLERMTDPNSTLISAIQEYNRYASEGNVSGCRQVMADNPDLANCQFSTARMNQLLDEIVATQKYYKEDVQNFINNIADSEIGISDGNPSGTTSYSSQKVYEMMNNKIRVYSNGYVITPANFGTGDTYTLTINGITANDIPEVYFSKNSIVTASKASITVESVTDGILFTKRKALQSSITVESIKVVSKNDWKN